MWKGGVLECVRLYTFNNYLPEVLDHLVYDPVIYFQVVSKYYRWYTLPNNRSCLQRSCGARARARARARAACHTVYGGCICPARRARSGVHRGRV